MHRVIHRGLIRFVMVTVVVATVVAQLAPSPAAQGSPGMADATVTALDGLTGCTPSAPRGNVANAINANGVIVGHVEGCYPNYAEPFYPNFLAARFGPTSLIHLIYDVILSPFQVSRYEVATEALSINDAGVVAGSGFNHAHSGETYGGNQLYAHPGGWLTPLAGAINQFGGYINNSGEVVGTTFFDSLNHTPGHATLWVGSTASDLGTLNVNLGTGNEGSIFPLAMAPNRSGANRIIVGYYYAPASSSPSLGPQVAVKWEDNQWSELPGPSGCVKNYTSANDVSDDGVVVGWEGYCGQGPALWENGQFRSLHGECQQAYVEVIGEPGAGGALNGIVMTAGGRHIIAGRCVDQPAVFYDDGHGNYTAKLLPLLPGDASGDAVAVNASGQLVGRTYVFGGLSHPVRWDVDLPNLSPVADAAGTTTNEDTPVNDTLSASDIDGDTLNYSIVANGSKGTAVVTNSTAGDFTYTPNPNVSGVDSFTFKVNDGTIDSNVATVTVTINPVNDAPVAAGGSTSTSAGTSVSGTLVATDVDSAALAYLIVANGTKGTAAITNVATGAYTYTPASGSSGTDTFTFKANDGSADSNVATMTVTITASSAPVASNGTLTIAEDASARETLQATDPDGQALVFSLVTAPTKGTVTITASSGRYRYVPQPNANGADSFTFKASDGATDSNIASVAITITPVNDPPVAVGTSLTTRMNQSAGGTLQATDVDNTPLTFALAKAPRRGTAVVTPGGTFTYTPDSGFTGKDSFMFRVTDPAGVSATATVSVTVTP